MPLNSKHHIIYFDNVIKTKNSTKNSDLQHNLSSFKILISRKNTEALSGLYSVNGTKQSWKI